MLLVLFLPVKKSRGSKTDPRMDRGRLAMVSVMAALGAMTVRQRIKKKKEKCQVMLGLLWCPR